jgi:hypothetical protein
MSDSSIDCKSQSTGVLVLGMHRSGTSVVSRALIALGVCFGDALLEPASDNPKGFFEDKDINALNVAILRALDCQWHTILIPIKDELRIHGNYAGRAAELLRNKFSQEPMWGLKEPRITRLLPIWVAAMADIDARYLYLLVNRNPLSVADSLAARNGIPRAKALALWAVHQMDGLAAVVESEGLVVDYDQIINQPSVELDRLSRYIGRSADAINRKIFIESFLEKALRHSSYSKTFDLSSPLLSDCMEFHGDLLALSKFDGPLRDNERAQAKAALTRARLRMASHTDWFEAIDAVSRDVAHLEQTLRDTEANVQNRIGGGSFFRLAQIAKRIFLN